MIMRGKEQEGRGPEIEGKPGRYRDLTRRGKLAVLGAVLLGISLGAAITLWVLLQVTM
jgi:hypothetical protein